ncbi:1-alkyl-2-acetylglycerophosphocholine esterase [Angomonas deanei]|uniref:WD domain, G-beta repeat, putative n=1 Tax=Angomonas deanei TaxID=59799 RepID=A0A7G2C4S3_9TRYP|nr:1-alkyl-2-acetylglycerophosphocholine esterase [Angomonas deanei]CAD2212892.1 WD domain, G-beta repeat, putative [Angomonas deanei]|eukprot:EPY33177.1 1-alkyl-2-acetylglycerophosphocholine esterase [Angomonas deanei]
MCSDEVLIAVSRDAVQSIRCIGPTLVTQKSVSNPCVGELSDVSAQFSHGIVCGTNGIASFSYDLSFNPQDDTVTTGCLQKILCVSITPDHAYIATGGESATVTVWNGNMESIHHLAGHTDWIHYVSFAKPKDELYLYSTGDDGVICQWDPEDGILLSRLDYGRGQSIQVFEVSYAYGLMAMSYGGPVIALYNCTSSRYTKDSGDDVLRLEKFDLITGAHKFPPTVAKFTDDCDWLVSAAEDETISISSVREPRKTFTCTEFITRRHCLPFMNTFTSIVVLAAPPSSSVIIIAACANDGSVVQWVVDPRDGRMNYTKRLQLHMGALQSMTVMR